MTSANGRSHPNFICVLVISIIAVSFMLTLYVFNTTSLSSLRQGQKVMSSSPSFQSSGDNSTKGDVEKPAEPPSDGAALTPPPTLQRKLSFTVCNSGCEFDNINEVMKTLARNDTSDGARIIIGPGLLYTDSPISLVSGLYLEFKQGTKMVVPQGFDRTYGTGVLQGNSVRNITVTNAVVESTAERGISAFSFVNSSKINIIGGQFSLLQGFDSAGFSCRDCSNVNIRNIHVSNASRLVDINSSNLTRTGFSSGIWILNSTFENASIEGIKVNYSDDVHILGNSIYDTANNGIDVGGNANVEVAANTLVSAGAQWASAIHTDSAERVLIKSNTLMDSGGTGIAVCGAKSTRIINNVINETFDSAIAVTPCTPNSYSIDSVIENNEIIDPGMDGIFVSANQSNIYISNNTVIMDLNNGDFLPVKVLQPNPTVIAVLTRIYQS